MDLDKRKEMINSYNCLTSQIDGLVDEQLRMKVKLREAVSGKNTCKHLIDMRVGEGSGFLHPACNIDASGKKYNGDPHKRINQMDCALCGSYES